MDILQRTNPYRRNFEFNARIHGTSTTKYRNIIRPYLRTHNILKGRDTGFISSSFSLPKASTTRRPTTRTQSSKTIKEWGLLKLFNKPIDDIYYDGINEMVDRWLLLMASISSGNNSHSLEMNSIIEELKEAKIIK